MMAAARKRAADKGRRTRAINIALGPDGQGALHRLFSGNYPAAKTCQYIAEELPTPLGYAEHMKCGKPSVEDYSWCPQHKELCLVPPKSKRINAYDPTVVKARYVR